MKSLITLLIPIILISCSIARYNTTSIKHLDSRMEGTRFIDSLKSSEQTVSTQQKENSIKLIGVVINKANGEPLPFIYIIAKKANSELTHTKTDMDGKFAFTFDTALFKLDHIQVTFSAIGFKKDSLKIVNIRQKLLDKELTISLEEALNLPPPIQQISTIRSIWHPGIDTIDKKYGNKVK